MLTSSKMHKHTMGSKGFDTRVPAISNTVSDSGITTNYEASLPPSALFYNKQETDDASRCITCGGPSCSTGIQKQKKGGVEIVGCPFSHDIPDIQTKLSKAQDIFDLAFDILEQHAPDLLDPIRAIDSNFKNPDLAEERAKIPYKVFEALRQAEIPALANNLQQNYVALMREAFELSEAKGPMHDIFSMLCGPSLCIASCVAGRSGHGSVEIPTNMAFMSNFAWVSGWFNKPVEKEENLESIDDTLIVIGSGFAGMCAAYEGVKQGFERVVVVEANDKPFEPGGQNILPYKFPHKRFDMHVKRLQDSGVEFFTGRPVDGIKTSLESLAAEFSSKNIVITTGATVPKTLELKGNAANTAITWANITKAQQAVEAGEQIDAGDYNLAGKTVAVIGTGDVAADILHIAALQGAKEVIFVSRRDELAIEDQPAFEKAQKTAKEYGIEFSVQHFMAPDTLSHNADGRYTLSGEDRHNQGQRIHLDIDIVAQAINSGTGNLKAIFGENLPTGDNGELFIPTETTSREIVGSIHDPNNPGSGLLEEYNDTSIYAAGDNVRGPTLAAKAGADGQNAVKHAAHRWKLKLAA